MRLVTFKGGDGRSRLGSLVDGDAGVVDLAAGSFAGEAALHSMQALIDAGETGLAIARAAQAARPGVEAAAQVRLLAPLPVPAQMRDFLTFEKHFRQSLEQSARLTAARSKDPAAALEQLLALPAFQIPKIWYEEPLYYKCNRFAVSGPDDDVIWPVYSRLMDYELELAMVIGRKGRDIPVDEARSHIFGFTIFNDFSARDEQGREMPARLGPAKGKDFDGANALGPCIVTADEIPDPRNLEMIARVNGEEWSRGNSRDMHFSFEQMIARASRSETLYPGEVFGSGTVGGGCGLEHGKFLKHGDVVELEITGIGILRSRVLRSEVGPS